MSNISVVFSFDENYVMPTLVAALSLLDSSLKEGKGGRYSLFFLTEKALAPSVMNEYEKYLVSYSNCSFVKFVVANGTQKDAFESRHLTRATYLRLEIPELIDLDKVIYSDIDVLFLSGLESLWDVCVDDVYLAATLDVGLNQKDKFNRRRIRFDYWQEYYNDRLGSYYQAGILLMNLKLMRETEIVKTWRRLSREKFNYHDMDIINAFPELKEVLSNCSEDSVKMYTENFGKSTKSFDMASEIVRRLRSEKDKARPKKIELDYEGLSETDAILEEMMKTIFNFY